MIITGGSGFVGTNLVSHFQTSGWETINLDINPPQNNEHLNCWQEISILNRDQLIAATRVFRPSVFLHFAARTDLTEKQGLEAYAANIEGVNNVIEAIKATPSIQRAVFASSQLVCELGYRPADENDLRPSTVYGQSKAIGEKIVREAEDICPTWIIVRPTSLWGPWFGVPYKDFFTAITRNRYVHPRNMKTLKQWGYVSNTAYQVQKLIEARADQVHGRTFYLADYQPVQLRDFADHVQQAVGARPIRTVPSALLQATGRLGDVAQKAGWKNPPLTSFRYRNIITSEIQDLEPLREIVGPLPYDLDQGIENTVQWLRETDGLGLKI